MSTILITGANRGLGLEFAREYAADGWRVLACSRSSSDALGELAAQQSKVSLYSLDVSELSQIDALAAQLAGTPIDVLLCNAGTFGSIGFAEGGVEAQAFGAVDYADWMRVLQVNVLGPMKMAEAFVEHVATSEQKKLIAVTSMLGSIALNNIGGLYCYRSSKAALNAVMKSLSVDLARQGILAAAVHPGWARTAMGGPQADIDAATAVAGVRQVIAGLTAEQLGQLLAYDGSVLPY